MTYPRALFAATVVFLAVARLSGDEEKAPDWTLRGKELAQMLAGLARQQGMDPEDFSSYRSTGAVSTCWGNGDVVTLAIDEGKYVVAVQSIEAMSVPGTSAQQVVLLTPEGRILDRLQCHINSRYGRLETSVSRDGDGARIAILFEGSVRREAGNSWHNWHTISFRGRSYTFRESEKDEHNEWDGGLCRAEIADGKLAVVFPRLEQPEAELARAASLRICYPVGHETKRVEVSDRAQIEALFASMAVSHTEPGAGAPLPHNTRIDVRLPQGELARLVFLSPTFLHRRDWGRIHLSSTTFHDRVAELVVKAEGGPVNLVPNVSDGR